MPLGGHTAAVRRHRRRAQHRLGRRHRHHPRYRGYLVTGPDLLTNGKAPAFWPLERAPYYLETAVPGSFAAGDVRHRSIKRVATAAGEGAMAIAFVHRYLEETA